MIIASEGRSETLFADWNASHDAVEAGVKHRFINESDLPVEALEIYTSIDGTPPDENDIVRFSEGGVSQVSR